MNMISYILLYICVVLASACIEQQTCRGCIRQSQPCVWCASESITGPRCVLKSSVPQDWCTGEIVNPDSTKTVNHHQINSTLDSKEIIQIRPRSVDITLRPGQTVDFDFSFTAAEDYPVDLYFLFDASMNTAVWKKLRQQIENSVHWFQTVTSNASVGFGTFTNKNVLPFTSIKNETLLYSFRPQLSLSNDKKEFVKAMNDVHIVNSPFIEKLNGGFDALAQAIMCENIGWRNISRKIVVFISDNLYLSAGDGKAAGIFNPYDGRCHTNDGRYTKELEMDYPSPSMINKLASEQKVTIIFVIDSIREYYDLLEQVINGAHIIDAIKTGTNEKTLVSQLKGIYEKITKVLKLNVKIDPAYENKIKVDIEPDCNNVTCTVEQTKEKKFSGKVTILEYFEATKIDVNISVAGIRETLNLYIKLIDECDCAPGNDSLCNGGGTHHCGICECHPNRSGVNCECFVNAVDTVTGDSNNATDKKTTCMMPNSDIECSGRGSCICGICTCGELRYRGRYCECDNELCPKDKNGRLCGHGKCQCGECICDPGWMKSTQRTCSCESSNERCRTGDHVCSDYGRCECNECKCPATICDWDVRSSLGHQCNPLPCQDCHDRQCRLLEPYALGLRYGASACGKRVNVTSVQKLDNETSWMLCSDVRANVGCYTSFVYKYDDIKYGVHLIVQSEHDCAESFYIYGGTCLGALLSIGILTLAGWKILSTYHDRKEYKRFKMGQQRSLKRTGTQGNPLYKAAVITTRNPLHNSS